MKSLNIIAMSSLALAHGALAEFYEPPPTTADPNTIQDCTLWHVASTGDTCASIIAPRELLVPALQSYNPSLAGTEASCTSKLVIGNSYCTEQNYGLPSEIYTSAPASSTTAAPTTTAPPTITTPTPHRSLPTDCNKFHFVVSGNNCPGIASQYSVPLATFYSWNPDVGSNCNNLWLEEYVCVGRVSSSTATTTAPTTTTSQTGIVTPTPHRSLPTDCNKFHFVVSGNTCPTIASQYNVPLATFYSWNPDVGSNCNSLWLEEYVCVGRVSYSTSTTTAPTTTTTGTGIATPTPHRTLPTNCDRFHFVVSGNTCPSIATLYNIPLAQFYTWNPDVGSNCNSLWLEEYVCVRTVGYVTPTSTTATTTSTGIATPTPHRTLPNNCDRFHFVVSGNTCPGIAAQYNVPVSQFYTWNPDVGSNCNSLWLQEYVCVRTVGYVPPATTTTTAPTTTPTPFQSGMVANCKQFHQVASGNTCASIASQYSITLSNFYSWNAGVGSSCGSLWLGYYVCVRV